MGRIDQRRGEIGHCLERLEEVQAQRQEEKSDQRAGARRGWYVREYENVDRNEKIRSGKKKQTRRGREETNFAAEAAILEEEMP